MRSTMKSIATMMILAHNPTISLLICISLGHLHLALVSGQCYHFGSKAHNPCTAANCTLGARCVISPDGQNADCVCPTKCFSYGDSRGSRQVCASNGQDYANVCELNRSACLSRKNITILYNGTCDPCNGVKCPLSQVCQIDDNRNPICACNLSCSEDFSPVCANNGQTFVNECTLRAQSCLYKQNLKIFHQGMCAETNACKVLKCHAYQRCVINRYGIAGCECTAKCPKLMKPICGTDSETYENECQLQRKACESGKNVTIRYYGVCDPASVCHKNHSICGFGSTCKETPDGNYTCICHKSTCGEEYHPVCGSNGITYTNVCKFRADMCDKKLSNITFQEGACVGCEYVNCQFYSQCHTIGSRGSCVCPGDCEDKLEPVCGSDMVTYPNECELQQHACTNKQMITVIKRGKCDSCQNVHCDFGARCENGECVCPRKCPSFVEPVCGSNNVTFENHCKLMAASCESVSQIRVQFRGLCSGTTSEKKSEILSYDVRCKFNTCRFGGVCVLTANNQTKCLCSFNCTKSKNLLDRICGDDGRIYDDECWLEEEMCLRQQAIGHREMSFCGKHKTLPCSGDAPLVNAFTKQDYNCLVDKCPHDSFCHKGADFAKCCPDVNEDEDCVESKYGCCPDEKTSALGPNYAGCASTCQCNRFGSYLLKCDPQTKQCFCKPGVGGLRCDRCEPGYWGLHKIGDGNTGCIPCNCNRIGSSRDDCEQMSGLCVCKTNFTGQKCDMCSNGYSVESEKCFKISMHRQQGNATCASTEDCTLGAVCHMGQCICHIQCSVGMGSVCASDGNTYQSECHIRKQSCLTQTLIEPVDFERCLSTVSTTKQSATTSPGRRSTEIDSAKDARVLPSAVVSSTQAPTPKPNISVRLFGSLCFKGDSFIEMKPLEAYSKVNIRLEFVAFQPDGILLYNSQTQTADGDYIALLVRDRRIELRFNLGSGSVLIQSTKQIKLGQLTEVVVERYLSEAILRITNYESISGKSEGPHKLLDLGENLFIGGTPYRESKRLVDIIGTRNGFVGCISLLQLNTLPIDLNLSTSKNILNGKDVDVYNNAQCSQIFCHDQGMCYERDHDTVACQCHQDYGDDQCQHVKHRQMFESLEFYDNSYIQLPTLQGVSQAFVIEIWLLTRSTEGLILYNGQSKGDFLELLINASYVHFNFDLGGNQSNRSGLVNIRSNVALRLGEWHRIVITRKLKEGTLQIDQHEPVKRVANGHLIELNLDLPLFLGGRPSSKSSQKHFNGAIQRIVVNGNIWQNIVNRSISHANINQYENHPCGYTNPCLNNGKCSQFLQDYVCKCDDNFDGKHCENSRSGKTISVDGATSLSADIAFGEYQNMIEIDVRTTSLTGVLLWIDLSHGQDYLALVLSNGSVELNYHLKKPKSHFRMKSTTRINDGQGHSVLIWRKQHLVVLEIDDKHMSSALLSDDQLSPLSHQEVDVSRVVYIGSQSTLPEYVIYPFEGCLLSLRIDGTIVHFKGGSKRNAC